MYQQEMQICFFFFFSCLTLCLPSFPVFFFFFLRSPSFLLVCACCAVSAACFFSWGAAEIPARQTQPEKSQFTCPAQAAGMQRSASCKTHFFMCCADGARARVEQEAKCVRACTCAGEFPVLEIEIDVSICECVCVCEGGRSLWFSASPPLPP